MAMYLLLAVDCDKVRILMICLIQDVVETIGLVKIDRPSVNGSLMHTDTFGREVGELV